MHSNFFLKTLFCETDMLNIFRSYGYIFFDMFFWLKLLKLTLFGIDNAFSCLAIIITIIYFYVKKIHTLFTYILMHIATLERFSCLSLKIQTFMIWRFFIVKFKFFRSWTWTEDWFLAHHSFDIICKKYTSWKCSRFL